MIVRLATPFDGPALAAIYRPSVVERCVARTPWVVAERDGAVTVGALETALTSLSG